MYRRLISASWSCVSMIWNSCGRFGIAVVRAQHPVAQAVERADPHAAHVDRRHRGEPGQHLLRRLVRERDGEDRQRRRLPGREQPRDARVRTRVLPLPAPARISAETCGSVTAARCSGLRWSRRDDDMAERPQRQPRGEARGSEPASRTRLNGSQLYVGERGSRTRGVVASRRENKRPGTNARAFRRDRRRRYQPMSCSSLNVRSCGVTTLCVRSPLIAGSMSWFGNAIVSQCDSEQPPW